MLIFKLLKIVIQGLLTNYKSNINSKGRLNFNLRIKWPQGIEKDYLSTFSWEVLKDKL